MLARNCSSILLSLDILGYMFEKKSGKSGAHVLKNVTNYSPSWGMGTHKLMPGKPGKGSKLSLQKFLILSPSNYSSHTISELKEKPPHFVELQHYFSNVKLLILKLIEAGI